MSCPADPRNVTFFTWLIDVFPVIVVEGIALVGRLDRRERSLSAGGGVEEVRVADLVVGEHPPTVAGEGEAPLIVRRAGEGTAKVPPTEGQ